MKKIAMLTSGGDAPGMNAAIRSVVKTCLHHQMIPFGIYDGYQGMVEGRGKVLKYKDVDNIIQLGGTILGSARCQEFHEQEGRKKAIEFLDSEHVDGLIVIGGDGTYRGANLLSAESGLPVIGLPGTIDNDIFGTESTIGFDTALNTVIAAVDKIRDTASSHHRIFFVEVMGRDSGFIALNGAIASGADAVLIPEEHTDIEKLAHDIRHVYKGRRSMIILVAEGDDAGNALVVMNKVKSFLMEYDLRHSVLGHIQRGGSPTFQDRILATKLGNYAVHMLLNKQSGLALGVKGGELVNCSLMDAVKGHASLNLDWLSMFDELKTK
ncbi:MAG: 6-phosphofructokinase [Cryomorphaceae bacterium]|jgi:6-phosphofructokinase 1|nr:6-phosphofructokinase [Cryomorphaceae bacterium]